MYQTFIIVCNDMDFCDEKQTLLHVDWNICETNNRVLRMSCARNMRRQTGTYNN